MPTWFRYLLFQVPGWVLAAIILFSLWNWRLLPRWLAVLLFLAWFVKDLLLYPFLRMAYETGQKEGSQALIGEKGISEGDLSPEGYVRVRGELWRAVAPSSDGAIAAGTKIEIVAADGMKVFVRKVDSGQGRRKPAGG